MSAGRQLHEAMLEALNTQPDPNAQPLTAAHIRAAMRALQDRDTSRCPNLYGLVPGGGIHRCRNEHSHEGECTLTVPESDT